jgi:hypothetical protein
LTEAKKELKKEEQGRLLTKLKHKENITKHW